MQPFCQYIDMRSLLMTTRGQLLMLVIVLALTCCAQEVMSSPRCVALCHRSEADSLCKRCRFREPMRFGKRSDKQSVFREPMRFGKRVNSYGYQHKRSVTSLPLLRLLMSRIEDKLSPD